MADAEASRKKADGLFGQIAMKLRIVTHKQLEEALELQRFAKTHKPLGVILMDMRYVAQEDLDRIIAAQREVVDSAGKRQKEVREDNLFGKVAIRLEFCTEDQMAECLKLQEELPPDRFMRLGDILVIKGHLTVEQVRRVLETQKGLIVYCAQCDTQYNVVMFRPGSSLQCYKCGYPLKVPIRKTTNAIDEAIYFGGGE